MPRAKGLQLRRQQLGRQRRVPLEPGSNCGSPAQQACCHLSRPEGRSPVFWLHWMHDGTARRAASWRWRTRGLHQHIKDPIIYIFNATRLILQCLECLNERRQWRTIDMIHARVCIVSRSPHNASQCIVRPCSPMGRSPARSDTPAGGCAGC